MEGSCTFGISRDDNALYEKLKKAASVTVVIFTELEPVSSASLKKHPLYLFEVIKVIVALHGFCMACQVNLQNMECIIFLNLLQWLVATILGRKRLQES